MITLNDFDGQAIRLTDERLAHILEHSEMQGQVQRIAETLLTPDSVILSHHDSTVRLYHKLFAETPVTRKYLVVGNYLPSLTPNPPPFPLRQGLNRVSMRSR